MGEGTKIEWCDHTFNPWWGCEKVSPGCLHCYAEASAKRTGNNCWEKKPRRFFGDKHWAEPLKWNAAAAAAGDRKRVFCASMADVFEDHPDLEESRARLFELIDATPSLDWLLLTKRPQNIRKLMDRVMHGNFDPRRTFIHHMPNVWLGATCEDQTRAEERIPELLQISASVRFLSCEPLLGPVFPWTGSIARAAGAIADWEGIDWVICGGESGAKARPMNIQWARDLRDVCRVSEAAFFMKQMGGFRPPFPAIPEDLMIREFPNVFPLHL